MAGVWWFLLLVPLLSSSIAAQDCDPKCSTQNCNDEGVCICDLPTNATMLQGDRPFMGGQYCNISRTMCDGSNTFWCENGLCNEIIQGENYTCVCKDGYIGDHCELQGTNCGDFFCYHDGQCNDGSCDCPADWRGSADCSQATTTSSQSTTSVEPTHPEDRDSDSWYLPVFVAIAVIAVAGAVVIGVMSIRKRSTAATEFHKLRQVQMRGFIEEDEDAFAHAPLSKAELA